MYMIQTKTILGIFTLFVSVTTFISGCTQKSNIPNQVPLQFDLYYSFGVSEKNILDTKKNLYVKDMVCNPPKEYDFPLTVSEKIDIYNAIVKNNVFATQDDFTTTCGVH